MQWQMESARARAHLSRRLPDHRPKPADNVTSSTSKMIGWCCFSFHFLSGAEWDGWAGSPRYPSISSNGRSGGRSGSWLACMTMRQRRPVSSRWSSWCRWYSPPADRRTSWASNPGMAPDLARRPNSLPVVGLCPLQSGHETRVLQVDLPACPGGASVRAQTKPSFPSNESHS